MEVVGVVEGAVTEVAGFWLASDVAGLLVLTIDALSDNCALSFLSAEFLSLAAGAVV